VAFIEAYHACAGLLVRSRRRQRRLRDDAQGRQRRRAAAARAVRRPAIRSSPGARAPIVSRTGSPVVARPLS